MTQSGPVIAITVESRGAIAAVESLRKALTGLGSAAKSASSDAASSARTLQRAYSAAGKDLRSAFAPKLLEDFAKNTATARGEFAELRTLTQQVRGDTALLAKQYKDLEATLKSVASQARRTHGSLQKPRLTLPPTPALVGASAVAVEPPSRKPRTIQKAGRIAGAAGRSISGLGAPKTGLSLQVAEKGVDLATELGVLDAPFSLRGGQVTANTVADAWLEASKEGADVLVEASKESASALVKASRWGAGVIKDTWVGGMGFVEEKLVGLGTSLETSGERSIETGLLRNDDVERANLDLVLGLSQSFTGKALTSLGNTAGTLKKKSAADLYVDAQFAASPALRFVKPVVEDVFGRAQDMRRQEVATALTDRAASGSRLSTTGRPAVRLVELDPAVARQLGEGFGAAPGGESLTAAVFREEHGQLRTALADRTAPSLEWPTSPLSVDVANLQDSVLGQLGDTLQRSLAAEAGLAGGAGSTAALDGSVTTLRDQFLATARDLQALVHPLGAFESAVGGATIALRDMVRAPQGASPREPLSGGATRPPALTPPPRGGIVTAIRLPDTVAEQERQSLAQRIAANDAFGNELRRMTRGLVDDLGGEFRTLALTGEANFKELARSFAQATADMLLQKQVLDPLFASFGAVLGNAGGSLFSSLFGARIAHGGGVLGVDSFTRRAIGADVFAGAPGFARGGIVGGEVPVIAHRGEGIFTPAQMAALGGTGGDVINNVTVHVNVTEGGAAQVDVEQAGRAGRQLGRAVSAAVTREIQNQMRPGGLLSRT